MIPIIKIDAETCGEAWELALEKVWNEGLEIRQHYSDEWSKEASVIINVTNPLKEPRFSRKDFISTVMFATGNAKNKPYREMEYVKEVMDGILDNRVMEGIESYSYHARLWKWGMKQPKHTELLKKLKKPTMDFNEVGRYHSFDIPDYIDQMEMLIQKAKEESISRKLQSGCRSLQS